MLGNEEPFDDIEAAERDWIGVQPPIPVDPVPDAQVLSRVMRILREIAAMDMPDGHTMEGPCAPEGSGELVRARVARSWEAHDRDGKSAPGQIIVCEAPVAAWQGLLGPNRQRGAIPLWGPESKERAIIAHMTHRVRQQLGESGYGLCTSVMGMQEGSGNERVRKIAWGISATGTAPGWRTEGMRNACSNCLAERPRRSFGGDLDWGTNQPSGAPRDWKSNGT